MSDLQFASEVIGHLVWPVLVGFVVFLFKSPIATVIRSLRRLTYNRGEGFSAEFGSLLDELPYDDPTMTFEDDNESHLAVGSGGIEVSESDPSVTILTSWDRVERALLGVSAEYGAPHTGSFSQQKRHLLEIGVLDANLSSTLEDLRLVRSEVVHRPDIEPTREDAQRYASVASNVVGVLSRWAAAGVPANFKTDAPDVIEPLTETTITVTVVDAEGELVGAVPISVAKVQGEGVVDEVPGGYTSGGRGVFKFLAPRGPGEVVFLIRAGDATKGQQVAGIEVVAIGSGP